MSDFKFLHNPSTGNSYSGTVAGSVITLASGSFDAGDVIYVPYSDTGSVYAYCTNGASRTFNFDDEIYENVPSSISTTNGSRWQVANVIYNDVDAYRISVSVSKALYSESYLTYNTSIDYILTIANKRREYFSGTTNKSVRSLILTDNIVFTDDCKQVAYKTSFGQNGFELLNNRFKSSIEFNIATK